VGGVSLPAGAAPRCPCPAADPGLMMIAAANAAAAHVSAVLDCLFTLCTPWFVPIGAA
jgi:hypothetical protein